MISFQMRGKLDLPGQEGYQKSRPAATLEVIMSLMYSTSLMMFGAPLTTKAGRRFVA